MTTPTSVAPDSLTERFLNHLFAYDAFQATRPIDRITLVAVLYLALPNLIFFFGWFRLPFALALAGLTVTSLIQAFPRHSLSKPISGAFNPGALMLLALVALIWCGFGGAGHFSYANLDWTIRDAVYGDLFQTDWPLGYGETDGSPRILRSAFGFFLPAALATKLLGAQYADYLLYGWTALGVFLSLTLLPLPARLGPRLVLCLGIVVFFSGMDLLGILVVTGLWPAFPLRLEWWVEFSYSSLAGQLFWGPNHALPLWIGMALFLRHWETPDFAKLAITYVPMTLIWTPFAIVGLAPFLALFALRWLRTPTAFPGIVQWVYALTIGILISVFLTLHISDIPAKTTLAQSGGNEFSWSHYAVFVITEFLALALLLAKQVKQPGGVFYISVAVLLSLPFVWFGPSNDLMLRASTPPLVALLALTLAQFSRAGAGRSNWLLVCILIIGANTPFNEIWRAATLTAKPADYRKNLLEASNGATQPHYIGKLDLPWLAGMLKPITPVRYHRQ